MKDQTKSWTILLLVFLATATLGQALQSNPNRKSKPPATPVTQPPTSTPLAQPQSANGNMAAPGLGARVTQGVLNDTSDPDDHVRCFFTSKQLIDLRPISGVVKLTEADQSKVLTSVAQAVDEASDKELTPNQKAKFISVLAHDLDGKLVGKTPGEALTTIMDLLYQITAKSSDLINTLTLPEPEPIKQKVVARAKKYGGETFAKAVENKLNSANSSWFKLGNPGATSEMLATLVAKVPNELAGVNRPAAIKLQGDLLNPDADLLAVAQNKEKAVQEIANRAKKYGGDNFSTAAQEQLNGADSAWFKSNDPKQTLSEAANVIDDLPEEHQSAADKTIEDLTTGGLTQASGSVVSSARNELNKLAPPSDIGCAYQILSWNEARLLFGRSVANDFIAVQVTVRNLNAKEEFIVHNAMLAVNSDIHGAVGQYFEGEDKIGIEAYNNAGESLTARGIVGNSITAASALLGALQPIVSVDNFSNAVSAFTGGVVPGWKTISPDHQKDQLLLIANSGFSATYTTKTVVGKSGVATFYTWFPVKPWMQGWWIQDCAQSIVTVGQTPANDVTPPQIGIDLERAKQVCKDAGLNQWKSKPYKNWSSISDQLFRDLSFAVVAGIHVQEDSKNKSSITDLKCPSNSRGELDLSQASSDGTIGCTLTGDNLDKVAKLRLENAANAVDPIRPEAPVTVSGDNTSAKATFKVSDITAATGDVYDVYSVGKDGIEIATGQKIHLNQKTVAITGLSPSTIDLGSPTNTIAVSGQNLDSLTKLCFSNSATTSKPVFDVNKGTSKTQVTLDITSSKLSPGKWQIYINDCSEPNNSKKELVVAGAATPQVNSFAPASAGPGQTVTILGSNLSGVEIVAFGGVETKPTTSEDDKLTVVVPTGAKSGSISVTSFGITRAKTGFKVVPKITRSKEP